MRDVDKEILNSDIVEKIKNYLYKTYNNAGDRPIFHNDTSEAIKIISAIIPELPIDVGEILDNIFSILEYGECNFLSPRYYGYITPRPLPITVIGDWISLIGNQTPGAWRGGPIATIVENTVIQWIAQFVKYEWTGGSCPQGIITSGGSMSNLTGLHLARNKALKMGGTLANIRYYICETAHLSILRSLNLLGAFEDNICVIPLDCYQRMDTVILREQIKEDLLNGFYPAAVVATYGTTSIGAIDDISTIKEISMDHNMWFHIDAASGGAYAGIESFINKYGSLNVGDSVAIDPSKWLFASYGIGCLLVCDPAELKKVYSISSDYWEDESEVDNFQMSFTCTRAWHTLGVYMAFCQLGVRGYHEIFNKLSSLADTLMNELQKIGCIVLRGSKLPILAFKIPQCDDNLHKCMIEEAIKWNIAYTTHVNIEGKLYIRVALSNYKTTEEDIFKLIEFTKKWGNQLDGGLF